MRWHMRLFAVLLAALFALSSLAEEISPPPLTIEELQELKKAALENPEEFAQRKRHVRKTLSTDEETAIIRFLDQEAADPGTGRTRAMNRALENIYQELVWLLTQFGTDAAVPVLVRCTMSVNPALEGFWCSAAAALTAISDRAPIREEDIRPLLDSADKDLAEFARQLWHCIRYEDMKEAPRNIIEAYANHEAYLKRTAGEMKDWTLIAARRGFYHHKQPKGEALRNLVADCARRIRGIEEAGRQSVLDHDLVHGLVSKENLLQLRALDELVRIEGIASFDYLVNLLESDAAALQVPAAFHLAQMTGISFPYSRHLTCGDSGVNVMLNRKAAAAWRKWRSQFGEAGIPPRAPDVREGPPGDKPSPLSVEQRLADFKIGHFRRSSPEFARPTDEVIAELVSADDRRILRMLTTVLRTKTLSEKQVEKIIASCKSGNSQARIVFLWQVLFNARSEMARQYLTTVVNASTDEGTLLEFLSGLSAYSAGEVPFLAELYATHKSAAVKNAIIDLACNHDWDEYMEDTPPQDMLIAAILEKTDNIDHKLRLLDSSGENMIKRALEKETEPAMRKALYVMLIERNAADWLPVLLKGKEAEEVKLAGLNAYETDLEDEDAAFFFTRRDEVPLMKKAAKSDDSQAVREAANRILDKMRNLAVVGAIDDFRSRVKGLEAVLRAIESKKMKSDKYSLKDMEMALEEGDNLLAELDEVIAELKETFDTLPEEAEIKAQLAPLVEGLQTKLRAFKERKGRETEK